MSTDNGRLPPQIMEQLKKKGWTWPPTEDMKRRWREIDERLAGSMHMDPEVRKEVIKSFPGRFPDAVESD
jgi:hypothetical protein